MKIAQKVFLTGSITLATSCLGTGIAQENVKFSDLNLETAVRSALVKPTGPLTPTDLESLESLSAVGLNITNLSGLEWATNLAGLNLSGNAVDDVTPLRTLHRLIQLNVNRNRLSNVSPLVALTNLTLLSLGDNLLSDSSPLSGLTNLAGLWLHGNSITSLTFLQNMTRLRSLELNNNGIVSLSPLVTLTNINSLVLGGNPVDDYSALSYLTSLTNLSVRDGLITNVGVLKELDRLVSLDLYGNQVMDVRPLAGLTNLACLDLRGNPLTNYELTLAGLTNLMGLYLGGISISNASFLSGLAKLTFLNLGNNKINDLSPLATLTNLSYLVLSGNPITNYTVLSGLTNLVNLELRGNAISNVTSFTKLSRLNYADLAYNNIVDISPLIGLTNLGSLVLTGNKLNTKAGQFGLTNLANLWLSGNSISNVTFLQDQNQLSSLILDDNRIVDPAPLVALTNLTALGLSRNPVSNYAALAGLTNLNRLWLAGNSISNLSFLPNLTALQGLELNNNRISDLGDLNGLTNLSTLSADYNRLTNIAVLENLSRLSRVQLVGNLLELRVGSTTTEIQNLQARGVDVTYLPTNQPPSLFVSTNWIVAANVPSSRTFLLSDDFTPSDQLFVTASSSNPELLPDPIVTVDSVRELRTLTFAPVSNRVGTVMLNLVSTDSAGSVAAAGILVTVQYATNVAFPDPQLEAILRSELGKPSGQLSSVDLLSLTELYVRDPSITNLSGLEWAANLKALFISRASITNLDALHDLTQLNSLGLDDLPLNDYSPLTRLTNLTSLSLRGASVADLSFLEEFVQLTDLVLINLRLTSVLPLAMLTNLCSLDLRQNRLTDISPLLNLRNLSFVDLRVNLIETNANSDLVFLQDRSVEVLYLPQNQPPAALVATTWFVATNATSSLRFSVADDVTRPDQLQLTAISSNPNLIASSNIFLAGTSSNRTLTITPAFGQTGTAWIALTVTDDTGLQSDVTVLVTVVVPQLVVIGDPVLEGDLRLVLGKPVGDLYDVDLVPLTALNLNRSNITSVSGLEWATNLTTLRLNATVITNLEALQNLSHLTSLSLSDSRLTNVSQLTGLTNLLYLDLSQNRLTDVGPLTNLPNLSFVDLRRNLLETITNSALNQLQEQGVSILSQPQRSPPFLVTPSQWFVPANTTSFVYFSAWNDGPPDEQMAIAPNSSTGNLLSGTNLFIYRDTSGQAQDWIVAVMPPTNYAGTSMITLIATNEVSMSTTVTVLLTISLPLPLTGQVLEETKLTWLTGGGAGWFGQTNIFQTGGSAAQSGSILENEESWLRADVEGPGILSFWWKISSEAGFDWLEFFLDDQLQDHRISGEVDWELVVASIPRGPQTVEWRYNKDEGWARGLDAAWLDQVSFVPLSWLEVVGMSTNGQCQLLLHPVLGQRYILESSTNLAVWLPMTVVVATNATMPFMDLTAIDSMRFYRLKELFASSIWLQNPNRVGNEFQMELHSPPGLRFEMQASTNLVDWSNLLQITNTLGTIQYTDKPVSDVPVRFYRALLLP